jgi:hypothetical protein
MQMRWEGVTEDEYEQAREKVGWDRDVPEGAKLHVAGFSDDGLNVLDVWESAERAQRPPARRGRRRWGTQRSGSDEASTM